MRQLTLLAASVALFLSACAGPPVGDPSPAAIGDPSTESPSDWSGVTRKVPSDFPTIQSAVDAAGPGDLILIDRGIYRETVSVTTPGLVIRGVDRNEVVIDGEFERPNGVEVLFADGVAVENITAMNNTINGFFWTGVRGYRGSYLTAINNGDYGVYAFDSGDGLFEHSYASGSPDASFYIGQCNPCDAVITDSIGENSGLGYSGTNASGLYLVNNVFRYNGAGIAPNSLDTELIPPAQDVVVAGNLVYDNGYRDFPHKSAQWLTQGFGVLLVGVESSTVTRNRVFNHPNGAIAIGPYVDANFWMSSGNEVVGNAVGGSGLGDLVLAGPALPGNCFEGNEPGHTMPPLLETTQGCEGVRWPALFEVGSFASLFGRVVENGLGLDADVFYGDMPHPGDQPQMPGGAEADVRPAVNVATAKPDLATIEIPSIPAGEEVTQRKGMNIMGVTFASTLGGILGLYAYVLPMVLYAAWVVIAIWEIVKREDLGRGAGIGWMAVILVVPFLGVVAYYIFGRSQVPIAYRWMLLAGGIGAYLLILAIGLLVGGVV